MSWPDGIVLVADPGLPVEVARALQHRLRWEVSVTCRRLPADDAGAIRLPDDVDIEQGQAAIMFTDHPSRERTRPIMAEVHPAEQIALISLPSLGAIRLRHRTTRAVERVMEELGKGRRSGTPDADQPDAGTPVRVLATGAHGRLRLLAGIVRTNRPWRLLPHLSKAFAAALAVVAYAVLNPTIWELGGSLGPGRMVLAMLLAIGCMVGWLIVNHEMWERPDDEEARELAVLFNAATVVTLLVGVLLLYLGLLLIGFIGDRVVLDSDVMSSSAGAPATLGLHLKVVWLVATIATVAGAVGTGFESDEAVRQAAYGYRQRERLDRDERRKHAEREGASW